MKSIGECVEVVGIAGEMVGCALSATSSGCFAIII